MNNCERSNHTGALGYLNLVSKVSEACDKLVNKFQTSTRYTGNVLSSPETAIAPVTPPPPAEPAARFRSEMGQISRHSAVFFLGTLFTAAAGYLFKIYVARILGANALGIYALGMTLVGFFGLFNGLGLPQTAVRFVAVYSATGQYQRLHTFLRHALGLLAVANILLAGVMLLLGPRLARSLYHSPELVRYLPLFAWLLVFGGFAAFLGQVLAGYKDIALRTVITNFIGSPLNIILGLILLAAGMGLRGYVLAQVASGSLVLVLLFAAAWKLTPSAARRPAGQVSKMESEAFWFSAALFGVSVLEFLLAQADKIMLGIFLDVRQVGIYAVAASLVTFVPVALQSVNQIFSSTIADLHARGERALLGRLFQTLTKWIIGVTLPLAFVMIVFSKPLMRLFGPAFEAGWFVLILGTLGQLVNAGVGSVGYLLLMSGNQRRLIRVQTGMAIFMVAATAALIRPFGMVGVALAAALTNAISNYLYLREVRAALQLSPYNRTYLHLLLPSTASLAVILFLRYFSLSVHPEWLSIVAALAAGYAVFCGLSLMVGLDDDDRMIVGAIQSKLLGAVGRRPTLSQ
jgi:O-antigen/teichoic acid export membrane protein